MSKKCLKCGYTRQPSDTAPDYECPGCGIVYAKAEQAEKRKREMAEAQKRQALEKQQAQEAGEIEEKPAFYKSKTFVISTVAVVVIAFSVVAVIVGGKLGFETTRPRKQPKIENTDLVAQNKQQNQSNIDKAVAADRAASGVQKPAPMPPDGCGNYLMEYDSTCTFDFYIHYTSIYTDNPPSNTGQTPYRMVIGNRYGAPYWESPDGGKTYYLRRRPTWEVKPTGSGNLRAYKLRHIPSGYMPHKSFDTNYMLDHIDIRDGSVDAEVVGIELLDHCMKVTVEIYLAENVTWPHAETIIQDQKWCRVRFVQQTINSGISVFGFFIGPKDENHAAIRCFNQ